MKDENIIQSINKASLKLLEPLTPEETYKRIVNEAIKLVKGEEGKISLMIHKKLKGVYSSEKDGEMEVRENGNTYKCYRTRKSFVVLATKTQKTHPQDYKKGYRSGIFIPLYYKKKSFGVLLIKSKTSQLFSQKELQILRLFGSIASLTIRKTQLLNETRQSLELKDEFIALAAHELRTPLTSMSGYIQLLHRNLTKSQTKEAAWTDSLLQESNRLKSLIEEILDINKINAGKLKYAFEETNVNDIVRQAIIRLTETYPSVKVKIKNGIRSPLIVGDRDKLIKAVYNIVENAAKFTHPESHIIVELKNIKSYSKIVVQDFGPGIREEDLPHVFDGFFKSKGNEKEGMGLGLYFTKEIVEGHQGEVTIQSKEQKGTWVEVKLPLLQI